MDIVFCNEDEAGTVCPLADIQPIPSDAAKGLQVEGAVAGALSFLQDFCSIVIISRGKKGCVASSAAGESAASPAMAVTVQDTVGAGDAFTAGCLHAWLEGGGLQQCTACGCAAGTAAVQCSGGNIGEAAMIKLRSTVDELLGSVTK